MTIRFEKRGEPEAPPAATKVLMLWIPPAEKPELEQHLFRFLGSLRDGRPQAPQPLVVEAETLRALYADPHPDLVAALRHCLDSLLVEFGPDPADWGRLELSPAALGVAIGAYTCLMPAPAIPQLPEPLEARGFAP